MLRSRAQVTQMLCERLTPSDLIIGLIESISARIESAVRRGISEITYRIPPHMYGRASYNRAAVRNQLRDYLKLAKYDVTIKDEWTLIIGFGPTKEFFSGGPIISVSPRNLSLSKK